jgi:tetratricopeptide (TPR) repeat protein
LPETLAGVITARLDRLSEDARRGAQSAAVIGREFRIDVLARVHDRPEVLDDSLFELQDRELILPSADGQPEPTYGFKHGLIQETAYASILLSRRRELHLRVADYLERVAPHSVTDLAHHYLLATDDARALPYVVAAGERAAQTSSTTEAIEWFRRAVPLIATVEDHELGRRAYEGLGNALLLANRGEEAAAVYAEMRGVAERWSDVPMLVSALNKLAQVQAIRLGQFEDAQRALADAEALAHSAADARGLVELATIKCAMALPTGNFPGAIETLGDSIEVARRQDMREELATALAHLAQTLTFATRFDEAWPAALECRRIAEELGNRAHVAEVLVFPIAYGHLRNGDVSSAVAAAHEGIDLASSIGAGFYVVIGAVTLGMLQLAGGDYIGASATAGIVIGAADELGPYAQFALPQALASQSRAAQALGREAYVETGRRNADLLERMEPYLDAMACADLGECALLQGDLDTAEERFRRGLDRPTSSWLLQRPRLLANLALVKVIRGDLDNSEPLLAEARQFANERAMRHVAPLLDLVSGRLAAARGQLEGAGRLFQTAAASAEGMGLWPIAEQARAAEAEHVSAAGRR